MKPVAREMVDQVLESLPAAVKAIAELQWHSSARGGELRKLRKGQIDMRAQKRQAASEACKPGKPCRNHLNWIYKPKLHKTAHLGHERTITFGPETAGHPSPISP